MAGLKTIFFIIALCLVHQSACKPTTNNDSEGRGIMSTLWGWITYPFSWWSSEKPEQPVTESLVASTTSDINANIDFGKQNVTIWCNDQTCTTMKCDKNECRNITCNLYDTDLRGECREYNITLEEPEEHNVSEPTKTQLSVQNETTDKESKTPQLIPAIVNPSNERVNDPIGQEHPLELEAVLSSTVNNAAKPVDRREGDIA